MKTATIYHYSKDNGQYIGVDDRNLAEPSWVEVTEPEHGAAIWNNGSWDMSEPYRLKRNRLLEEVDAVAGNALRWAVLDAETQAAWATYRQALLDVPQQSGFPNDITWPTEPEG